MAFTLGKKGTKRIPRDPRNRCNAHPNPGGGGGPPSDPFPLQVQGGNTDHSVLLAAATSLVVGGEDVGLGGSLAAASVSASVAVLPAAFSAAFQRGGSSSVIDLHSPTDANTNEDDTAALYWTTAWPFSPLSRTCYPPLRAPKMFSMPA
jgi:hypothetical protein